MVWGAIGLGVSVVGSLIGGSKSASAAKQQANAQNAATDRQLSYDTALWEMAKERMHANRQFAVEETAIKARNEGRTAAYADAVKAQRYNYDLMIRNREQESLNQQYLRSDDIYNKQVTLNTLSAEAARSDEIRKLREIHAETRFEEQEAHIESLIASGKMRAMGLSGRSAEKADQSNYAKYGRLLSAMNESLDSAGRNSRAVLEEISRDKTSADLAAYAQKMLHPGTLPMPLVPFKEPMAEYPVPREIKPFDYGPAPVAGAYVSASAAANQAWGSTISGIAGTVGSFGAAYAQANW